MGLTIMLIGFLISFMVGFYSGTNVYRLVFMIVVLSLITTIIMSMETAITGSPEASMSGVSNAFTIDGIFLILFDILGIILGMRLKDKSLKVTK